MRRARCRGGDREILPVVHGVSHLAVSTGSTAGFTSATAGTAQTSLDALRNATATSYYKGEGSLWVKLVSAGNAGGGRGGRGGATTLQVSR
jgi:hypothetical protein